MIFGQENTVFKILILMRNSWEMGIKTPERLTNDREQIPMEISTWSQHQPEMKKQQ